MELNRMSFRNCKNLQPLQKICTAFRWDHVLLVGYSPFVGRLARLWSYRPKCSKGNLFWEEIDHMSFCSISLHRLCIGNSRHPWATGIFVWRTCGPLPIELNWIDLIWHEWNGHALTWSRLDWFHLSWGSLQLNWVFESTWPLQRAAKGQSKSRQEMLPKDRQSMNERRKGRHHTPLQGWPSKLIFLRI